MNHRFKWRIAKYFNLFSPAHIDVELSTKCKLNCEFCFRKEHKYSDQNMDVALFMKIINQAHEFKVPSIKFNWRGEALEHPKWETMFHVAKEWGFYTMLNTSLAMELTSLQKHTIARKIDNLKISFDSSDDGVYNKIRKGADFFQTLFNLEELIEYRKQYKMPKVFLNRRTNKLTEPDEVFKEFFGDTVDYDIRPAMDRNYNAIFNTPRVQLRGIKRKYCGQPSRRLVIAVNGDVYPCCVCYAEPEEMKLGNIKDHTIKEIWDSEKRKQLVWELKRNHFLTGTCKNCTSGDSYK